MICCESDCTRENVARGYCRKHYEQHKLKGTFIVGSISPRRLHRLTNICTDTKTATCAICGPNTNILPNNHGTLHNWKCTTMQKEAHDKQYAKIRAVRRADLLSYCEACGTTTDLCWDHDHKTDEFRGTLCKNCNFALGLVFDNVKILQGLIKYMKTRKIYGSK